ncbi:MAG: glycosyltransferase family 2 protein [Burkholderiales bacterium]|nr:MAG: glycosyltransferase family 2 protein [Betaproteobacteria bacterium]TAG82054.1 MAG: glycosyltransferase family 2 protein [Burkholderiales bacterium]
MGESLVFDRMTHRVLIAIPIYNGYDALERCLQALVDERIEAAHRIVAINDASSDLRIAPLLEAYTRKHARRAIEVRHNRVNRGFTWNANQAITATRNDEHLLLLNSDAIVTEGWLDQMLATLARDEKIGTVTPFSNNATICSYPDFLREWPVPPVAERKRIAKTLANHRTDEIDIPTAVGFCMLISRGCLDAVENFDEANFPRGYGEENDFCRRATLKGFRNVMCTNAYVAHEGSQSFTDEKHELMREGGARLLALHPDYNDVVAAWIKSDPARARREQVNALLGAR